MAGSHICSDGNQLYRPCHHACIEQTAKTVLRLLHLIHLNCHDHSVLPLVYSRPLQSHCHYFCDFSSGAARLTQYCCSAPLHPPRLQWNTGWKCWFTPWPVCVADTKRDYMSWSQIRARHSAAPTESAQLTALIRSNYRHRIRLQRKGGYSPRSGNMCSILC